VDKYLLQIIAILCLTILEIFAIVYNIDGFTLLGVVAVIAGIAGYRVAIQRTTPPKKPK